MRVNQDYHKKAEDLDTRLGGDQQGGFDTELNTFGRDGVVLGPISGAPNAPRDQSQHPRARNDYELELELIQTQMAQKQRLRLRRRGRL